MRGGVVLSSSSGSRNARVILGVAGFSGKRSTNSDGDLVGVGWHKDGLVDLLEALANPRYEVRRLLAMADVWREADNHVLTR